MNALNSPPTVRRNARGRLLPGSRLNAGGRPISAITELRARYSRRLPEIFDRLVEMAMDNSQPGLVQLAAIRLALDHLIGRPQISIDAIHARVDIGELYRRAMVRANAEINGTAGEKEIQAAYSAAGK
jgi:hypothetical protein